MTSESTTPESARPAILDPRERHFRVPSPRAGLALFLRCLTPAMLTPARGRSVLYVHGGTFPSALSIAHRFDGYAWRDALCAAGWHVWGLDFHGFGASDPYPEMAAAATAHPPLGRAAEASRQLERAVRWICARDGVPALSLIAHSWGTMVAGDFAGRCPDLVDRIVFFGPIARREPTGERPRLPGWRPVSLQDQWDRFTAEVPAGEAAVLSRRHFDEWGERYLDSDRASRERDPAAVAVPGGAFQDIFDAWVGEFPYDPARVRAPIAIIRGEWDGMCTDADARWLFERLTASPGRRDIKIARATHLMHLEESRFALYRETTAFLAGEDRAAIA